MYQLTDHRERLSDEEPFVCRRRANGKAQPPGGSGVEPLPIVTFLGSKSSFWRNCSTVGCSGGWAAPLQHKLAYIFVTQLVQISLDLFSYCYDFISVVLGNKPAKVFGNYVALQIVAFFDDLANFDDCPFIHGRS